MKTQKSPSRYISNINYWLGSSQRRVKDSQDMLLSGSDFLVSVGFDKYHYFRDYDDFCQANVNILKTAGITTPDKVIFYSGIDQPMGRHILESFTYRESRIMNESGFNGVPHIALHASGCSGAFESIVLASMSHGDVLCLFADMLPTNHPREVQYNIMSDAVSTAMISDSGWLRIVGSHFLYAQQFWNTKAHIEQITASYFTFATRCIQESIERFGVGLDQIDLIIPHNVSLRSWEILCTLTGFPIHKVFVENIARVGHTVSSDILINLEDARKNGYLKSGMKVLGFTYGFGSSWSTLLLEVV